MALAIESPSALIVENYVLALPRRHRLSRIEGHSFVVRTKRSPETIQTAVSAEASTDRAERIDADVLLVNKITSLFNTRISYQYDKELGQVTVKIIDRDTEEVVMHIPPEALTNMRMKLRENLQGIILDHTE